LRTSPGPCPDGKIKRIVTREQNRDKNGGCLLPAKNPTKCTRIYSPPVPGRYYGVLQR